MILILTIGCPCSGKSYYSQQKESEGFVRISQDDQGKKGHIKKFKEAIENKQPIVVDRMNFNVQQRKKYIDSAREHGYRIHIVHFSTDRVTCWTRFYQRKEHPTIKDEVTFQKVLQFFDTNYEEPTKDEYDTMEVK